MNRDYIDWLETLPCNRKPQKANQWMSEWAPLPEHVDLPRYEEIQQEWNQRCLLYTSPSPRDMRRSRMPSSA